MAVEKREKRRKKKKKTREIFLSCKLIDCTPTLNSTSSCSSQASIRAHTRRSMNRDDGEGLSWAPYWIWSMRDGMAWWTLLKFPNDISSKSPFLRIFIISIFCSLNFHSTSNLFSIIFQLTPSSIASISSAFSFTFVLFCCCRVSEREAVITHMNIIANELIYVRVCVHAK